MAWDLVKYWGQFYFTFFSLLFLLRNMILNTFSLLNLRSLTAYFT